MRALLSCLVVALLAGCSAGQQPSPGASRPSVDEEALREGLAAVFAGDHPTPEDRSEGDCFVAALLDSTTPA